MKGISRILVTGLVLLCVSGVSRAGSIWAKSNGSRRSFYSDDTARQIGDILTIIINEHSIIENEIARDMSRNSKRKASITSNFDLLEVIDKLTGGLFTLTDIDLETEAESDFESEADYESDRSLRDQVTVTVQDVLPNGNLVLVGRIERKLAGDTEIVHLSGVARPSDITFANTVNSDQVADFQISYSQRGQEKWVSRPGWLDRILNVINPF